MHIQGRRNQITEKEKRNNKKKNMKMRVKNNNLGFGNLCTEVLKKPEKEVRE